MVRMMKNEEGARLGWRERRSGSGGECVDMGFWQRGERKTNWLSRWLASAFPGCIACIPIPSALQNPSGCSAVPRLLVIIDYSDDLYNPKK